MKACTPPGNPSSPLRPVRLPLLWLVAVWSCAGAGASAQPPVGATAADHKQEVTSHLAVLKQQTGQPVLVINYPWKVHRRPSIEVRLVRVDLETMQLQFLPVGIKPDARAVRKTARPRKKSFKR